MKIDVRQIIADHFRTLKNHRTGRVAGSDMVAFFVIPVAVGTATFIFRIPIDREVYNVTITFFGIFIALLLNVQVAIFSIFQRKWSLPQDKRLADKFMARSDERRALLGELNANISYLTLFCCVALVEFFCFFMFRNCTPAAVGFAAATCLHFFTTLLMVIKRTHVLFSKEYELR